MIQVKYDTTFPLLQTDTAEIWSLGGGVYVAIPIQDRIKAERGLWVRIRALTPEEQKLVDDERQRIRTACAAHVDATTERVLARLAQGKR